MKRPEKTPSFVYRYQMVMFVMDYAGELDDLTRRYWRGYQKISHSCLLNPERNQDIKFSAVINDDDSADLLFTLPLRERVRITRSSQARRSRTPAGAKTPPAIFRRRLVACIPGCDVG
ncbi:Phage tail completion protein R [Escherichia coli]|nr:Phage tail completion protein R [Escherichia coli]